MSGMGLGRLVVGLSLVSVLIGPGALLAQENSDQLAEEGAIAVVEQLFDAMRAADSASVRSVFADGVTEFRRSGTSPDGEPAIGVGTLEGFVTGVGGAEVGAWDEQIVIRDAIVNDNLVTLVTPYVFYFNGNLSHCGVNVFLVAKAGADWKIVSLVDTNRRGEGVCEGWLDD